ncbi:MAG: response regulator, partial [Rubrivivax sp.]|nr:response regulator [Rubrivivax sp.]
RPGPDAGLAALERDGPFAVVVSDMRMPGMDGVQFLARVKARSPDTVRLMLTAFPDMETAIEAVNQGNIFRFLTKPVSPPTLTAALEAALDQFRLVRARHALLEAQLRHAQKMELVGQCAAGLAHDMRNLLSIIQICAHRALEPRSSPEALAQSLQQIHDAAAHATNLTQQLLRFSRRQNRARFEPVDLKKLLEELSNLLRPVLTRRISLECQTAPELEPAWGDAVLLGQVVMNLVLNARDAMPQGGRIRLQAEPRTVTAHTVSQHPGRRLGRFLCLTVSDTGCGMDTVVRNRLFEPFFTTKAEGGGTGLGLAVVADIIKEHQGWTEVHSAPGRGTTFEVYLPRAAAPAAPPPAPPK